MIKKTFTEILLVCALASTLACSVLTGCATTVDPETGSTVTVNASCPYLASIPGKAALVYDVNTRIVYYQFSGGYKGYMSPYLGENGHACQYVDGKITEIKE